MNSLRFPGRRPVTRLLVALMLGVVSGPCLPANEAGAASAGATRSTAQPNVILLPDKLELPGLSRQRQIRVYLPPSYATAGAKRYPVLYMHDAQNLFDDATSYAGEWGVDETLNELAASGQLEVIVVGIDHGGDKRMSELNPWTNKEIGASEGKQYTDFIVQVLKPEIDRKFRTRPDRLNTGIMGSSMGGLISHYAINRYPEIFSKAGLFSASYWVSPEAFDQARTRPAAKDARLYLMTGGKEGVDQVENVLHMNALILQQGHPPGNVLVRIVPNGEHNEALWRTEFRQAVLWLFRP